MNNIYNKLAELQRQIQHCDPHMNSGDMIQIEAPDFDPDIDDISSPTTDERPNKLLTQGTASPTHKTTEPEIECSTPATSTQQIASQDTDWPDTITVEIPPQIDQPEDQGIDRYQTQHNSGVHIGLYTLSSRRGLHMGCCIMKGVSEQCIARLLLTVLVYCRHPIF